MTLNDVNEAIAKSATGPRRVQVGQESVEQHPLADQIAAAEFLANQQASQSPSMGIRFAKFVPPGAS